MGPDAAEILGEHQNAPMPRNGEGLRQGPFARRPPLGRAGHSPQAASALAMFSHIFFASANSIIVLSRKNSSFSTPA